MEFSANIELDNLSSSLKELAFKLAKEGKPELATAYLADNDLIYEQREIELLIDNAKKIASSQKQINIPNWIVETAPGIVGEFAQWITSTARYPQPILSLGNALIGIGVLKGHKVQTETGLRTNLYGLALADSGSGKGHPMKMLDQLFSKTGNEALLSGVPVSDVGVINLLHHRGGRAFVQWDEIGHALQAMTDPRSASHEKKILGELLNLYTKADSVYRGRERGSHKLEPRLVIDQPCLGLWGATTFKKFYKSVSCDLAADGFLPRILIFPVENPDIEPQDIKDKAEIPSHILDFFNEDLYLPESIRRKELGTTMLNPVIIPFTKDARLILKDIEEYFRKEKKKERIADTGLDAVWTRGYEITCQVALVVSCGEVINEDEVVWAFSLVKESLKCSCDLFKKYSFESKDGQLLKEMLFVIKNKPGSDSKAIFKKFQNYKSKDLHPILETLIERGQVKVIKEPGTGKKAKTLYYYFGEK